MLARFAAVATLALAAGLVAAPAATAASAPAAVAPVAATAATAAGESGANEVAIPYLDETTISPAQGWRFADCAAVNRASPLVADCAADGIRFAATEYDPEFGDVVIPIGLTNGRTSTTIDYIVSLAPPEPPEVMLKRYPHPAPAGAPLLLPLSDLGIACPVCDDGGALQVVSVTPEGAGSAAATSTHLVVRPSAGFTGELEVAVRYADDFGFWSQDASFTVPVYRPSSSAPFASSVYRQRAESGATDIDLTELVAGEDVVFLGCGSAVHGRVLCGRDGSARYVAAGDAPVDQFSFHIARGGDHATGSVTLVDEDADTGLPGSGPAPADAVIDPEAATGVRSVLVPRGPAGETPQSRGGLFGPLIGTLDRVGAE